MKNINTVLVGLLFGVFSMGELSAESTLNSEEIVNSSFLVECVDSQCHGEKGELPMVEVPGEKEQIKLYKKIYSQYNNEPFDYQKTHMEGLDEVVKIMYSYFNQHLIVEQHREWLTQFWAETIEVIESKHLTFEYFVNDFQKLMCLKLKDQVVEDNLSGGLYQAFTNISSIEIFRKLYESNIRHFSFYDELVLRPYQEGLHKKFPFLMPIFQEDGILSIESLIEAEIDAEDLLYVLVGLQMKRDPNDCTKNSEDIISFFKHDIDHFTDSAPYKMYIAKETKEDDFNQYQSSSQELVFHYLIKYLYENQKDFTKADLVSMFILLHERGLFQGAKKSDRCVNFLGYVGELVTTDQLNVFWEKYGLNNKLSFIMTLIILITTFSDDSSEYEATVLGRQFDFIYDDDSNMFRQGIDADSFYAILQSQNINEFSGRDVDVLFEIRPKMNTSILLNELELRVVKNAGSEKLTEEEIEYFKEKLKIDYAGKIGDFYLINGGPLCLNEVLNLLNYAYEGTKKFSNNNSMLEIDLGIMQLKQDFFNKYKSVFEQPEVQEKIKADLMKFYDYMNQ